MMGICISSTYALTRVREVMEAQCEALDRNLLVQIRYWIRRQKEVSDKVELARIEGYLAYFREQRQDLIDMSR